MFVDRYYKNYSALYFVKLMVDFQFHFNRFNGMEKIVDEINENIHPSVLPYAQFVTLIKTMGSVVFA